MAREDEYKSQLVALGIYDPVFDAEIHMLCILERELSRTMKAWKATAAPDPDNPGKRLAPSVLDDHYAVIKTLRDDILKHRESLGLTPKGLKRLRGKSPMQQTETGGISSKLDALLEKVSSYE